MNSHFYPTSSVYLFLEGKWNFAFRLLLLEYHLRHQLPKMIKCEVKILMDTPENSEHKNSSIECFRCAVCCIKFQVRLNLIEAHRIADHLGLPFEVFLERYTDHRWYGPDSLLRQLDGACVFLVGDTGSKLRNCRIHMIKPQACRDWTPGLDRPECREGLAKHWQLSVNSSGQLEGSEENLQKFHSFLESLITMERADSALQ